MKYLKERIAFIKGLAEGFHIDDSTPEKKLLKAIVDVLGDFAEAIDNLETEQTQIKNEMDDITDDVSDLEDIVYDGEYGEDDEEFDDEDDFYDDEDDSEEQAGDEDFVLDFEDEDEDEEGDEADDDGFLGDVVCPVCMKTIQVFEEMYDMENEIIICPYCGKEVDVELDFDEECQDLRYTGECNLDGCNGFCSNENDDDSEETNDQSSSKKE